MDPSHPRWRSTDPAQREEAQRCVINAKNFLAAGDVDRCWQSLVRPLGLDAGAPGLDILLVTATALRAPQQHPLPWGEPNPYAVLGLNHTVPAARDLAVVESHYRRASDLLNRRHPNDPCWPAFTGAARLVTEAWNFLSDPQLKDLLDAGYGAAAPVPAPPPPNLPALPPPPPPPPPNLLAPRRPYEEAREEDELVMAVSSSTLRCTGQNGCETILICLQVPLRPGFSS